MKFNAPYGYYLNVMELRKLYKEIKPDVINVHYASGYGTLVRRAKKTKTSIIISLGEVMYMISQMSLN